MTNVLDMTHHFFLQNISLIFLLLMIVPTSEGNSIIFWPAFYWPNWSFLKLVKSACNWKKSENDQAQVFYVTDIIFLPNLLYILIFPKTAKTWNCRNIKIYWSKCLVLWISRKKSKIRNKKLSRFITWLQLHSK